MDSLQSRFPDLAFFPLKKPTDFNNSTIILPAGHTKKPGCRAVSVDTIFQSDVQVVMRDGIKIYTDIFRPCTSESSAPIPAVIAWSPYGKRNPLQTYDHMGPFACGLKPEETSGYQKFEAPDPADWCGRGYAIINPDARGAGFSEGQVALWGDQEAHDFHDLIDWVSKQPWCNGSVATAGNSWLAISQINVAARDPHPALKAIAPWEAATDTYRDFITRGGIPRDGFLHMLYKTMSGTDSIEDGPAMLEKHPLFDEYWATKVIPVGEIDTPMYLTASYSTLLHSRGSFEAFDKAKTRQKWLRVHHTQEWYDLYRKENMDDLQAFFDKFCKGLENNWDCTAPLRLSLLGFDGSPAKTIVERPTTSFTSPRTENRKYYLQAGNGTLSHSQPRAAEEITYDSHHLSDCADFKVHFDTYTELAGYPSVKLWMSCNESDDMDVNVQIRKIGRDGSPLVSLNYPVPVPEPEVESTNVAKFLGCDGKLRASHRVSRVSQPGEFPVYEHDKAEKIAPGSVVEVEIPFWPIGMVFEAGEGIMLRVAGHDLRLPELSLLDSGVPTDKNVGKHVIHTGGQWDSCLTVPVCGTD